MNSIVQIFIFIFCLVATLSTSARDFENEGLNFSSKIKMFREAGEDVELAFENRKGIYFLSHTTKDFEKLKAMFSMAKERESVVKVTVDSMNDQILSASEVKGSGEDKNKGKNKAKDPNSNW